MGVESGTLLRVGVWGQVLTIALAALCWASGLETTFYLACGAYLVVSRAGIAGIARAESLPTVGPIVYPFMIPGFLHLYYFGVRYDAQSSQ